MSKINNRKQVRDAVIEDLLRLAEKGRGELHIDGRALMNIAEPRCVEFGIGEGSAQAIALEAIEQISKRDDVTSSETTSFKSEAEFHAHKKSIGIKRDKLAMAHDLGVVSRIEEKNLTREEERLSVIATKAFFEECLDPAKNEIEVIVVAAKALQDMQVEFEELTKTDFERSGESRIGADHEDDAESRVPDGSRVRR